MADMNIACHITGTRVILYHSAKANKLKYHVEYVILKNALLDITTEKKWGQH